MTEPTQAVVEDMSRSVALDRLQRLGFVGRVAFIVDGRPMIMPINYLADSDALADLIGGQPRYLLLHAGIHIRRGCSLEHRVISRPHGATRPPVHPRRG
jgi:hypothetical protein